MSTSDERAMILKMLQEGKISVEEADSLLDVLSDGSEKTGGFATADAPADEPAGRTSTSRSESTGHRSHRKGKSAFVHVERDNNGDDRSGSGETPPFDIDIDLSGLSEGIQAAVASMKSSMSGVSETLKNAFAGMGDISFDMHDGRMGKARAEREQVLLLQADEIDSLLVANTRGDVRVIGGDEPVIRATATVTAWASDEESAEKRLADVTVELQEAGRKAELRTDTGAAGARVRVDLEMTVPRSLTLDLSVTNGDLWIEDVAAACSVQAVNGDISVANIGDSASCDQRIATQSGDIVATSVAGTIALTTTAGDITVDEYRGELSATSKSGDVRVQSGHGTARLQSVSGDLSVEFLTIEEGEVEAQTVNGDICVAVPSDANLRLSARSISGDLSVDDAFHEVERSNGSITATLGSGALPASLSTVAGDIDVEIRR
jgi:hypothetical protein